MKIIYGISALLIVIALTSTGCRAGNVPTLSNTPNPSLVIPPAANVSVTPASSPNSPSTIIIPTPTVVSTPATAASPSVSSSPLSTPTPIASPSLTPISSPTLPAVASPTPSISPQNELSLLILSLPVEVSLGSQVTLIAATEVGAQCNLTIYYNSGPAKLPAKIADVNGLVNWTWIATGSSGIWPIVIEANKEARNASLTTAIVIR